MAFGNYDSSKYLCDVLNEIGNSYLSKKLLSAYNNHRITLKELKKIEDKNTFLMLNLLSRNNFIKIAEEIKKIEKVKFFDLKKRDKVGLVFTLFNNVIKTDYKEMLRERTMKNS